jgi:hypothetical protein
VTTIVGVNTNSAKTGFDIEKIASVIAKFKKR